jgi:hypothetical protein
MPGRGDTYVVDIETVGTPWTELDERTQQYLLGRAANEAEREAVPRRLGLAPGTGRVIVIGMQNITTGSAGVLVEGSPQPWREDGPQGFKRFDGEERALLGEFWKLVARAGRIVTFNGRGFDGPFLMLRSTILGVAPTVNLAGYRYTFEPHCDLAEVFNFHGAVRSDFSLDYWCRRFGISSPKDEGLQGHQVQQAYEEGRLEEIVRYCARDVAATASLYAAVRETLLPLLESRRT